MKKRILYVMHIDWDWIKQRPHFIAEELSNDYKVFVNYPITRNRVVLTKNSRIGLNFCPYIQLPFRYRFRILFRINKYLLSIFFKIMLLMIKPDFIWLTSPELLAFFPSCKNKIIYDCMDDICEFKHSAMFTEVLESLERQLLRQASLVFVSSEHLKKVINLRVNSEEKVKLIRNAYGGNILPAQSRLQDKKDQVFKIGYIGTISSWFDYEALLYCLQKIENIEFHLIGPVETGVKKEVHPRIYYYGPVEHQSLAKYCEDFDCLILPFKVNKLIESVDPVKLYEYINFNKPIISVYYQEIDRFSPFVYFYNSHNELYRLVLNLVNQGFPINYSPEERKQFLENNSWDNRLEEIKDYLKLLK